jgi:hypothetical protein
MDITSEFEELRRRTAELRTRQELAAAWREVDAILAQHRDDPMQTVVALEKMANAVLGGFSDDERRALVTAGARGGSSWRH